MREANPAGGRDADAQGTIRGGSPSLFSFVRAGSPRAGHARPLQMHVPKILSTLEDLPGTNAQEGEQEDQNKGVGQCAVAVGN